MTYVSYQHFKRSLSNTRLELLRLLQEHNLSTRQSSIVNNMSNVCKRHFTTQNNTQVIQERLVSSISKIMYYKRKI
jgi:predicted transcriptional regulator